MALLRTWLMLLEILFLESIPLRQSCLRWLYARRVVINNKGCECEGRGTCWERLGADWQQRQG